MKTHIRQKENIITNRWNRIRYTIHSLYYDQIVKVTEPARKRAIEILDPDVTDTILQGFKKKWQNCSSR